MVPSRWQQASSRELLQALSSPRSCTGDDPLSDGVSRENEPRTPSVALKTMSPENFSGKKKKIQPALISSSSVTSSQRRWRKLSHQEHCQPDLRQTSACASWIEAPCENGVTSIETCQHVATVSGPPSSVGRSTSSNKSLPASLTEHPSACL